MQYLVKYDISTFSQKFDFENADNLENDNYVRTE